MGLDAAFIDAREPAWVRSLTFGIEAVAVQELDCGDLHLYCGEHILGVERKTSDDLLSTLRDDRLFPQLIRLREFTPYCYLAITGTLQPGINGTTITARKENNWNWSSVAGALLSVQEIGVNVLLVPNDTEYEAAMVRLANRDRTAIKVVPPRDAALLSEGEAILAGLPGIGADRAHAILKYAGSVSFALSYLTDDQWEGPKAPGIGPGIKQRIRRAFGLLPDQTLNVTTREGHVKERNIA